MSAGFKHTFEEELEGYWNMTREEYDAFLGREGTIYACGNTDPLLKNATSKTEEALYEKQKIKNLTGKIYTIFEISKMVSNGELSQKRYNDLIEKGAEIYHLINSASQITASKIYQLIIAEYLSCKNDFERDFLKASVTFPEQTSVLPARLAEFNITCKEITILSTEVSDLEEQREIIIRKFPVFIEKYKSQYPNGELIDLINILNVSYVLNTSILWDNDTKDETSEDQNPGTPRIKRAE